MRSILALIVGVVLGIWVADPVIGFSRSMLGEQVVRCAADRFCVGDEMHAVSFDFRVTDRLGGLDLIVCRQDGEIEYHFLNDILAGQFCAADSYSLEFRNTTTRTLVQIENGTISRITRGPLHTFDL
tara:strand:- start:62 stop:442 length:381 start_codon:yes stop_codon:yes gene_type:complete